MLKRVVATCALGASVVAASFAVFHGRSAGPSEPAQLTVTTPQDGEPTLPGSVTSALGPGQIGRERCTQQSKHTSIGIDARVRLTVQQLYTQADYVVVADAKRQAAYWQLNAAQWLPMTLTQYHVTKVVKGTPGAWMQIADLGASSDSIPTCRNLAYIVTNLPLPTIGQTYVLFARHDPATGALQAEVFDRFPIINGKVQTEAALHPAALTAVASDFAAAPLDAFLAGAAIAERDTEPVP